MSLEPSADAMQRLVDTFRALLDETLILVIAGDHDLSTSSGYQSAYKTLQDLAEHATVEEAAVFHPNDYPDHPDESSNHGFNDSGSTSATSLSHHPSLAQQTDSSTTDLSMTPAADSASPIPRVTVFNNDSDETKYLNLRGMFSELKEIDIKSALKKSNGDFQTALDDLLNIQYLESTGQRQRGVDGFFQPEDTGRGGKKKKNKRDKKAGTNYFVGADLDAADHEIHRPSSAKDLKHQDEIAFLADRIEMSYDQVSNIYYRKKCSSGAAAADILDQYVSLGIKAEDDDGKARAKELGAKYRNIPDHFLFTLVQVTGSIPQFADDIAALLSKHFAKNPWTQRLDLTHRLTPLPDEELEVGVATGRQQTPGSNSPRPGSGIPWASSTTAPRDFSQAFQKLQATHQAKREAESYASQLSRRGGGSGGALYKQAAHVYRERSHEHATQAQKLESAAADLLVEQQSTAASLDLHGVSVRDGVRIARQKVRAWWQSLGEFRARTARERPYTVITGLGRHNASGVSQLRKAVVVAILNDGWQIKIETGRFVVQGRGSSF